MFCQCSHAPPCVTGVVLISSYNASFHFTINQHYWDTNFLPFLKCCYYAYIVYLAVFCRQLYVMQMRFNSAALLLAVTRHHHIVSSSLYTALSLVVYNKRHFLLFWRGRQTLTVAATDRWPHFFLLFFLAHGGGLWEWKGESDGELVLRGMPGLFI